MDLSRYKSKALLEILEACVGNPLLKHISPQIKTELVKRLGCHEANTKIFSPFGSMPEMTKDLGDFIKEFIKATPEE